MTKDKLKAWLASAAMVLTGIANFMWGPLAWAKPVLSNIAALLSGLAAQDALLDAIVNLINAGAIVFPHTPAAHTGTAQLALLTHPTSDHLDAFRDSIPAQMV